MFNLPESIWWGIGLILALGIVYGMLGGCASMESSRTATSGLGTLYEPQQYMTVTLTVHFEERPERGVLDQLVSTITSIPQAVVAGINQPINETLGGDRKEVVLAISLKEKPDDLEATLRQIVRAIEASGVDASITHNAEMKNGDNAE